MSAVPHLGASSPSVPDPRDQLDALTSLVLEVSSQRGVGDVLDVALRQCLTLTASEFGFVGLIRSSDNEVAVDQLEIVAIHGFHPAASFYTEHRVIPLRPNIFNRVVLEDRAVRTGDATNDPQRVGQPRGHPMVRAFLGVPLRLDGRPIGMIGLANRALPYEDDHERLVLTYASLIAVLVHQAQLYEQLQQTNDWLERLVGERTRELAQARDALAEKASQLQAVLADTVDAQEGERRRIAADIHDGINQLLIGALLEVTSGEHRIANAQPEAAGQALASARDILTEVAGEIRRVVHDLHPPVLEALGLAAALRDVTERVQGFSGIRCSLHVSGVARRLPLPTEVGLFRVVQEALQNVAVHSGAGHADVRLTFATSEVSVTVRDDGRGFDRSLAERTVTGHGRVHLGLGSMRRRVESLAGSWQLETAPGRGTRVRVRVPMLPEPAR
jgi:signal transduction histidine kinase